MGILDSKQKLNYAKVDHNVSFCEKRHFFAENWHKSQKIVIKSSTPGDASNELRI
jgi:hypothetical protein